MKRKSDGDCITNQYIKLRVSQNKNFMNAVTGPTGSGKSYLSVAEGELLDPNFCVDNICFTPLQLLDRINDGDLKKGSFLLFDEAGVTLSARSWQSVTNKLINYLLQTWRHKNFIFFITVPHIGFIDSNVRKLMHANWQTVGINYCTKQVEVKPYLLQVNQSKGEIYRKWLRFYDERRGLVPVERLHLGLPSKELLEAYERKKDAFTASLNKSIRSDLEGLEPKQKHKGLVKEMTPIQEQTLKYFEDGLTVPEIAKKRNVIIQVVYDDMKRIKKKGIKIVPIKQQNKVIKYEILRD